MSWVYRQREKSRRNEKKGKACVCDWQKNKITKSDWAQANRSPNNWFVIIRLHTLIIITSSLRLRFESNSRQSTHDVEYDLITIARKII